MTHPGTERRAYSRASSEVYTTFAVKENGEEGLCFSRTLSVGGLSFVSRLPIPQGTDLELSLYLPNLLEPLKTEGRIVHTTPRSEGPGFQIGISFQTLGEIGRAEIRQFIEGR